MIDNNFESKQSMLVRPWADRIGFVSIWSKAGYTRTVTTTSSFPNVKNVALYEYCWSYDLKYSHGDFRHLFLSMSKFSLFKSLWLKI